MKNESFKLKIDDKFLEVEFKNLAERTNSSVFIKFGETCLMATAVMSKKEIEGIDFFPLTVAYEERFYAIGKIFGSRFMKREGRPSEQSILTSRLIDRAVRPLFPADFKREVQIIITCLSWDKESDLASLGLIAASIVLSASDIPWDGPVAPVRIGMRDGKMVAFPTFAERESGNMDLLLSGLKSESKKEILINMIEAGMKEVPEEDILKAVELAKKYHEDILNFEEEIAKKIGKEKIKLEEKGRDEEIEKEVKELLGNRIENILKKDSIDDLHIIREELGELLKKHEDAEKTRCGFSFFEKETERLVHEKIIEKGIRFDGRNSDQIRELSCDVNVIPRVHGTGLFCRGETKVLSFLTLGGPGDQKIFEEMELNGKKRFMHHYNFPPSCVGETGPLRGPGRREIGHGMLGEKALRSMIPDAENFPYTIRVVSEVLCSNGSSSMASTCAACLALMDGGVPIKNPVSGIAMGLMMEMNDQKSTEDKNYLVLTDVQGEEDHYGDMDFKATGTKNGITALQMDIKVRGITVKIMKNALEQSKKARMQILAKMLETIPEPRKELSPNAPRIYTIKIRPDQIGEVIGTGGKIINEIIDECGVLIDIEETGEVFVTAENEASAQKAIEWIKNLTKEVIVGDIYQGKIKRILEFGAFAEILPGQEGMIHISQLAKERVNKVTDIVKIGDIVPVKVISIDEQGRINLSLKEARK
ncbi:MAG TPA: polyribonucleotide nucleotidyltransferase [Candidatus Pacearchaeota archaeon]|nr:polyribonucleotide nucleotidyltransferase [Candidatus Pacearchaeota archaeon]HPR79754.1 polyribonucleotide nucleotidyltransferase [Candidatus Pacearchaeota archaeon]